MPDARSPLPAAPKNAPAAPSPRLVRSLAHARRYMTDALGPLSTLVAGGTLLALDPRTNPSAATSMGSIATALSLGLTAAMTGRATLLTARSTSAGRPRSRNSDRHDLADPPIHVEQAMAIQVASFGLAQQLSALDPALAHDGFWVTTLSTLTVASLGTRRAALVGCALAVSIELAIAAVVPDKIDRHTTQVHVLVLVVMTLVLSGIARARTRHAVKRAQAKFARELERLQEQARSYRLIEPDGGAAHDKSPAGRRTTTERAQRTSVGEIQTAVRFALDLLKRSLEAHTAVLLFQTNTPAERDGRGGRDGSRLLRVADVVTDAKAIAEGPFSMSEGVLGAVSRRRAAVTLTGLRAGYRIPWYPRSGDTGSDRVAPAVDQPAIASIVAAPILDGNEVRGVLCVDRRSEGHGEVRQERPFTAQEEELVASAARFVLRAVENERVFSRLERAKAEQDQLYAAAQRLSGALTEAEVIEAGVASARAIASFDLVAITVVHEPDGDARRGEGQRLHEVRAVAGAADFESLVGLRFVDNGGLVSQAVRTRCPLPHRGEHDPETQVVFTRRHPLRIALRPEDEFEVPTHRTAEVRSVLVVPLTLRDRALGTLVLASRHKNAFREWSVAETSTTATGQSHHGDTGSARTTLEVLASHIATSLANARMFAKLEELATTDGLTGLLNKRVLLELGTQKVRAAARYQRPLAVIQTDIDHFKKVNDTYGHDVGDQVIRGLAGILRRLKRATDYVARFGGEEFVIVCEETDAPGALTLAERVREELARTTFHAASGPFQVTCSLGVAVFPHDGNTWDTLYKATDEALYASKRNGRNRATLADVSASRLAPAKVSQSA